MTHRGPGGVVEGIVISAVVVGLFGVVLLAVAGGMGADVPAWLAAACGLGGGFIGWAVNTPRRP